MVSVSTLHAEPVPDTVLMVDDNATNLQLLYQTLDGRGYKLLVAKSGEQALNIAARAQPALVLLDIMMPGMDGYEVCERLKRDPVTEKIAVIFLSALDDTSDKVHGFHLGAVDYIAKPFQVEEVIARVDTHLKIHRLEQDLERRNRQLEILNDRILQAMGEGIFGLDRKGQAIFVNHAAAAMTGWSESDLTGSDLLAEKADGARMPMAECVTPSSLTDGRIHFVDTASFIHRDGSRFPVEYSCAPIHEDERITGVVVVFRDISERIRTEAELKRSHEALQKSHQELLDAQMKLIQAAKLESVGRLAAGVAHEVKNPLAVIQLGLEYLSAEGEGDETEVLVIADMLNAVQRADTVIKGLLDFSREKELDLAFDNINRVIDVSLQLVKHELTQHNIRLFRELDDSLPDLDLDANKVQQVFINLFMNAIQAMGKDGDLIVRTTIQDLPPGDSDLPSCEFDEAQQLIRVDVEDTGSGISDEGMAQIFDPFFTTKPVGQGTGLGLSVSRNIIKLHGGEIGLDNRPEGGVVARILLPVNKGAKDGKETNTAG